MCKSGAFHIQKSVPQGSSPFPLLFALYMNTFLVDMQEIPGLVIQGHADDILLSTTTKRSNSSIIKLRKYMPDADTWSITMGMAYLRAKTELIHFFRIRVPTNLICLSWNHSVICPKDSCDTSAFGLTLNWTGHSIQNALFKRLHIALYAFPTCVRSFRLLARLVAGSLWEEFFLYWTMDAFALLT